MNISRMLTLLALILFPFVTKACFQIAQPPIRCSANRLSVNFSYEGKPLSGALVTVYEKHKKSTFHSRVDKDGWITFQDVPTGNYKLIFDGPSHETFDVDFTRLEELSNSIFVRFYADYCQAVSVHPKS